MHHFATLFDKNYLSRGLALYESLSLHLQDFKLFVLCLDNDTWDYLQEEKSDKIHPIRLDSLEENDPTLLTAKNNRSSIEYIFTLSPVLPLYILENFEEVDLIITLDADIYFFDNPAPVFDELEGKSVLITPHRLSHKLKEREIFGYYNVSFQAFRKDSDGLECLRWWKEKCLEWCYDKFETDRFADQKYLDFFEAKFKGITVLQSIGAGLAPWNIENYTFSQKNGKLYVNDQKIIFYHFHHMRFIRKNLIRHGLELYQTKSNSFIKNKIYKPYINHLIKLNRRIGNHDKQILRAHKVYKGSEFWDLLIYSYSFFRVYPLWFIEIHLEKYYNWYLNFKHLLYGKPNQP